MHFEANLWVLGGLGGALGDSKAGLGRLWSAPVRPVTISGRISPQHPLRLGPQDGRQNGPKSIKIDATMRSNFIPIFVSIFVRI